MQFWRNLSDRERLLVIIAGVLFAIFIAFQAVAAPVVNWRAAQRRALDEAHSVYELVTLAGAQAAGAAAQDGDVDTPARNALAQSATAAGVNLIYVNVRPDGAVDANAAGVSPEALFAWMQAVERDYGLRVVSADIAREQDQASMVRAQLTFARRGGT